jgi:hypothetical protein
MARISKFPLHVTDQERLNQQLAKTLARLTTTTSDDFLNELFGPEEKLMLAKRLAAVVMYAEGHSSYRIWKTLHLSPATANTIRSQFEAGKYEHIKKLFVRHKTDYRQLLKIIDTISRAGLPPLAGPGRWGELSSVRGTRSRRRK